MKKKIGEILREHGWVDQPALTKALQHQQFFGARLGTCLLELNLVEEDHLIKALAEQYDLPAARIDDLRNIPQGTLDLVPTKMAVNSRTVPFERFGTEVSVVMLDPNDLVTQDELSFVVSRRIKVFVTPEVRILEALEKHYDYEVESRFSRIWDRLNRARYLWQEEEREDRTELGPSTGPVSGDPTHEWEPSPAPVLDTSEPAPTPPPAPPPPTPTAEGAEEAESVALPDKPAPRLPPPTSLEELEARFEEVTERDDIARLVLTYLLRDFDRVLLFMVRGGEVAGWMGEGAGVEQTLLKNFELEFEEPSLFLNLREGSPFYRGPLPRMESHQYLSRIWGGGFPKECLLLPVRLKDRLVTAVYCDRGDAGLGGVDVAEVQRIGRVTERAFERFLLRKKRRAAQPD